MKRVLAIFLCLLLLTGCTAPAREEPTVQTETTAVPTQATEVPDPGLYLPSSLETESGGVLRLYAAGSTSPASYPSYYYALGSGVLIAETANDRLQLTLFSGENLSETARFALPDTMYQRISVVSDRVYLLTVGKLYVLDSALRTIQERQLPEEVDFVLPSRDGNTLFYTLDCCLFAEDLNQDTSVLIQEYPQGSQLSLDASFRNDEILQVSYYHSDYEYVTEYVRREDGARLGTENTYVSTYSGSSGALFAFWQDIWCCYFYDGQTTQVFIPKKDETLLSYFPESNCVLFSEYDGDSRHLVLRLYDLSTGCLAAEVSTDASGCPVYALQTADGYVYWSYDDPDTYESHLVRWDVSATPVTGGFSRLTPVYTQDAPDEDGLARCAQAAAALSEKLGIDILVGQDAITVQPWDYTLEMEYQVPLIQDCLEELEALLEVFPEGFFGKLLESYDSVGICIVRSITGNPDSGSISSADGLQYWEGNNGYIALCSSGNIRYNIYHELSHLMDTYILAHCDVYDDWVSLNPQGFEYDFDYIANQDRADFGYLEEGNQAFVDLYSMSFPTEDRARIMEYACNPGNEGLFQSPILQNKLKTICTGIRTAFGLTNSPVAYVWEQYLTVPLAYTPET